MEYVDAQEVLAIFASDLLPKFADKWSRWPTGTAAFALADEIDSRADALESVNPAAAQALGEVADELRRRRYLTGD